MKKILSGIIYLCMLFSLTSCTILHVVNNSTSQTSQDIPSSTPNQSSSSSQEEIFEPVIKLISIERERASQTGFEYPMYFYKFEINFESIHSADFEIETGSGVKITFTNISLNKNNCYIADSNNKYDSTGVKLAKFTNVRYFYSLAGSSYITTKYASSIDVQISSSCRPNSSATGSSSDSNAIKISTVSDFKNIKNDNSIYELQNDIDFQNQVVQLNITFSGTLNGNGYKLKNIRNNSCIISNTSTNGFYPAIFSAISKTAVVKNLELVNCNSSISTSQSNLYSSILCKDNYGTIENVVLKASDITTNFTTISSQQVVQGGLTTYNYGTIKNVTLDDVDVSLGGGTLACVGGITCYNNGTISNSVIIDSSVTGGSAGQVAYINSGTIENVAVINCDVTASYIYGSSANIGGIVATNAKIIKNSYVFDTDLHLIVDGTVKSFDASIGGIAASNSVGGVITKCYFMGDINIPTKQQIKDVGILVTANQLSTKIRINAGGICGKDSDRLESNFSDCKITGFASKSLTVPTLSNPIYRDILSVGIKRQNETRLVSDDYDSNMTHSETYASIIRYDASSRQYKIKYFTDNNGSISSTTLETDWSDFLHTKKSIVNSNQGLVFDSTTKFYPYIKDEIGYKCSTDYQTEVKMTDARSTN